MIAAFVILISPTYSQALSCAPFHPSFISSVDVANRVLVGTQVDDPDRRLAEDFAKDNHLDVGTVKRRYAATGDLVCNGGKSQANLTLVDDVVTTAAHTVMNEKGCGKPQQKLKGCKFLIEIDGEKQEYPIDHIIDTGYACGTNINRKGGADWAILRLGKKVDPRVKPYRIDPAFVEKMLKGSEVTMVGKSFDWPKDKVSNLLDKPKHYGNCKSLGSQNVDFDELITSNCDSSEGLSGGGMVTRGNDPALIGVHEGSSENRDGCPNRSKKTSGPASDCWFTAATAVAGDFKAALIEIEKTITRSSDQIPGADQSKDRQDLDTEL